MKQPGVKLVDPSDTYYFLERKLCLDVVFGRRPRLSALPKLLAELLREPLSVRDKCAMTAFFLLVSLLPNKGVKALLAYRSRSGRRSALGLARQLIRL